jgi:putative spermidine/putrescine transport system permease protein/spermidine/putrescine transport system permease protein
MSSGTAQDVDRNPMNERLLRAQDVSEQRMLLSLATPALLMIVAIVLIPVGWLFYLSFIGNDGQLSLEHYQKMVEYKSWPAVTRALSEDG